MGKRRVTREQKETIHTLLTTTELPYEHIAAKVNVSEVTVRRYAKKFLTEEERKARIFKTYSNCKSLENNPLWKGEELDYVNNMGYRYVRAPEWWEGFKNRCTYALEHQVVYAAKKGLTCIPEGYDIHHVDGDKLNNEPENLVMMKYWVHVTLHNKLKAKGENE